MPTSKSSNQGPGPDQRPAAITMDAELAGRLVAALEQLGGAVASDRNRDERLLYGGTVDPVRARASRDYEVLRGMLGRADAPTPLRMLRRRPYGGEGPFEKDGGERSVVDNEIVVLDQNQSVYFAVNGHGIAVDNWRPSGRLPVRNTRVKSSSVQPARCLGVMPGVPGAPESCEMSRFPEINA